jgi:hypothetical protein
MEIGVRMCKIFWWSLHSLSQRVYFHTQCTVLRGNYLNCLSAILTSAVSAKVKMIQRLMKLCSSFSVIKYHKGVSYVSYIDNRKNHIGTKGDLC